MNTESIFESFYSSGANIILKYNANTEHSRWFVFIELRTECIFVD
jgi:hypothetical protein